MRIGIDARFFGPLGKGLGRYTQKLVENLEKIDTENEYFVFLRKENWDQYQPAAGNFKKVLADIPWYSLREQIQMPRLLDKYRLDLAHFPHFNVPIRWKGNFVVTIHDLILLRYPTRRASTLSPLIYLLKKIAYWTVIKHAVKKSHKIIAVSEHTKKDILDHFGIEPGKISVTYESFDIGQKAAEQSPEKVLAKYGIIKPYLLYVGNAYPHKNLERLVLVFRELVKKHPHLQLVLAGREDYFYGRLKKFTADNWVKRVVFTDFVPDEDLGMLYREALLYVFPSLYEGFGLPPLEAMSRSVPVASSNASCIPEILGEAAVYFDPTAMAQMAEVIERAVTDIELRKNLMAAGEKQIKKYSWKKMAKETLEIYSSCA